MTRKNDSGMTSRRARLTSDLIARLSAKPTGHQITIRDTELRGFACRLGTSGSVSWVLQYLDLTNRQRLYTLTQADFEPNENSGNPGNRPNLRPAARQSNRIRRTPQRPHYRRPLRRRAQSPPLE